MLKSGRRGYCSLLDVPGRLLFGRDAMLVLLRYQRHRSWRAAAADGIPDCRPRRLRTSVQEHRMMVRSSSSSLSAAVTGSARS